MVYNSTNMDADAVHTLPHFYIWTLGDIVGLHMTSSTSAQISSGIVNRVSSTQISVAFDQSEELSNLGDDSQYYIINLANDVTYRRLRR